MKLFISVLIFTSFFSLCITASENPTVSKILKIEPKEQTKELTPEKTPELNELTPEERVLAYRRMVQAVAGKIGLPESKL